MAFFYFIDAAGADDWLEGVNGCRLELVDMIGSGYVVECCISALNRKTELRNFQTYITDAAYLIMRALGYKGDIPRYYELMHPQPKDERTAEQIAEDVLAKHGLKVVG